MKKVRIAVIGIGWFGEIHCDAISAIPSFELAALCTRTESRLAEMGEKYGVFQLYTDYKELLTNSDIDAVSIVTMWDHWRHLYERILNDLGLAHACASIRSRNAIARSGFPFRTCASASRVSRRSCSRT